MRNSEGGDTTENETRHIYLKTQDVVVRKDRFVVDVLNRVSEGTGDLESQALPPVPHPRRQKTHQDALRFVLSTERCVRSRKVWQTNTLDRDPLGSS